MKTFKVIIGLILLLPGICSLAFMAGISLRPGPQWLIWIVCFAISAFGIWLLQNTLQKTGSMDIQTDTIVGKDIK